MARDEDMNVVIINFRELLLLLVCPAKCLCRAWGLGSGENRQLMTKDDTVDECHGQWKTVSSTVKWKEQGRKYRQRSTLLFCVNHVMHGAG